MPNYSIALRDSAPPEAVNWNSPYWSKIKPLTVARFHPRSSRHHPLVQAKVAHSSTAIHLLFRVQDRFVIAEKAETQTYVCQDSCVEAFLQPKPGSGYFNFEMNCAGVLLLYYVTNSNKMGPKDDGAARLTPDELAQIKITPSITQPKPFKITGPITWTIQCSIPIAVMEKYVGPLDKLEGQSWRGNFFKCADWTKYPHWASWAPVGAKLWFHQKERFGDLYFRSLA